MASLPILLLFLVFPAQVPAQAEPIVNVAALQTSLDNLHSTLFGTIHPSFGILADTLGNVRGIFRRLDSEIELIIGFNNTLNDIQDDIHTVKQRQAAAAVFSVCQLSIFLVYLGTIIINYLVRWCKVQQERQQETLVLKMEERLQERKTRRRSANKPPKEL